jgi:isocitrate lyase
MCTNAEQAALLQREWKTDPRWAGITRNYTAQDVIRLRASVAAEHPLAKLGAGRLWDLLHRQDALPTLGALVGDDAEQATRPGSRSIYLPGWQAAGLVDAFELMTDMIKAGAAGLRLVDQLPGRKVLVPTGQHIETLAAARLAADVLGVPSLLIARSGARTASLLTSDVDDRDHEFLTGERTPDGLHRIEPGLYAHVTRALAFAPYADMLWLQTPAPDLAVARAFADIIRSQFPDKLLAYSCHRPLTGWAHPADASAAKFHRELAAMGYHFHSAIPGPSPESTSERAGRHQHDAAPAYA